MTNDLVLIKTLFKSRIFFENVDRLIVVVPRTVMLSSEEELPISLKQWKVELVILKMAFH